MNTRRSTAPSLFPSLSRRLLPILALAAAGAGLCALLMPAESRAVAEHLDGFPDSDIKAQHARPYVIAALCFLPALAALIDSLGGTLDRYITRRFLGMFALCLTSLFTIWMLIDLTDNLSDFRESPTPTATAALYYSTRLPAVVMLLLPYSLLLSLLESLGKLSTHREVIAMIQAGRGVLRITLPLIIAGTFCTLFALGLNYHWAPVAEGKQSEVLAEATGKDAATATKVLYRSLENRRLWMVREFPTDYQKGRPLAGVEVTATDARNRLVSRLSASHAHWNRETRQWTFENAGVFIYQKDRPPEFVKCDAPLVIDTWDETPWQIIKPGLSAEYLGIPDLSTWLRTHALHPQSADPSPYLTHWHYRWALPFTCLVTVLLATPLAIHFSRRGAGGGIFLAVALSALMLVTNTIIIAFGEAGTLRPVVAAWLPNAGFALIGIYLYRRRITGRPIYHSLRKILLPG